MKKVFILLTLILSGYFGIAVIEAESRAASPCVDGMADIYPCQNIDLLAHVPLAALGGGDGADIWGWTDTISRHEYALINRSTGTTFVDVTNPTEPIIVGRLPTQSGPRVQRDVKVLGNYALIVSEADNHGMQVFDLTRLRGVTETVEFSADTVYTNIGKVHNVVTNEANPTYAVLVGAAGANGCSGGLHVVNMIDPLSPTFAGCFSADGYTHDAQCITYDGPDEDYINHELCFAANVDTLTIVDITDPSNMEQISRTAYPSPGYTHQGWLTEDSHYFLLNDELDEYQGHNTRTYVMDVRDLDAPVFHMFYDFDTTSADHNLYTHNGRAYLANYNSGLRILDLHDIANKNLYEVGYIDIYPADDALNFRGAWSVYPYFESGNLIVSSRDDGLFVLKANVVPLSVELATQGANSKISPSLSFLFVLFLLTIITMRFRPKP